MKDELVGQIMKEIIVLRAETYGYLKNHNDEVKKRKRHKKVCHKKKTLIPRLQKQLISSSN